MDQTKQKKLGKKIFIALGVIFIFGVSTIPTWYFYNKYKESLTMPSEQNLTAEEETASLIKAIATHVVLPSGETPTVATVTDAKALRTQNGFKLVANGDKVLIYSEAQKAYIYRPKSDRVVDVVSINFTGEGGQVAGTQANSIVTPVPSSVLSPSISPTASLEQSSSSAELF